MWQAIGAPVHGGFDAELLAQIAVNPTEGLAILVDAVPALLAADWAAVLVVPADWALRAGSAESVPGRAEALTRAEPAIAYASWRAPESPRLPEVTPLRGRAMSGPQGVRYAVAPFGRAGLVLLVARGGAGGAQIPLGEPDSAEPVTRPAAAGFHATEVDRLAQLTRAAALVLGDRIDLVSAPPAPAAA